MAFLTIPPRVLHVMETQGLRYDQAIRHLRDRDILAARRPKPFRPRVELGPAPDEEEELWP